MEVVRIINIDGDVNKVRKKLFNLSMISDVEEIIGSTDRCAITYGMGLYVIDENYDSFIKRLENEKIIGSEHIMY